MGRGKQCKQTKETKTKCRDRGEGDMRSITISTRPLIFCFIGTKNITEKEGKCEKEPKKKQIMCVGLWVGTELKNDK